MRPLAAEDGRRQATPGGYWAGRSVRGADRARDAGLVAVRVERAGGDEGASGRTADAGTAMHDDRRRAVPARSRIDQLADMLPRSAARSRPCRSTMSSMSSRRWLASTISLRAPHHRDILHQRHDMPRAGLGDGRHAGGRGSRRGSSCAIPDRQHDIITRSGSIGKVSARKLGKTLQIARLRGLGGPGREIIALQSGREFRRHAEKAPRLRLVEAGERASPRDRPRRGRRA